MAYNEEQLSIDGMNFANPQNRQVGEAESLSQKERLMKMAKYVNTGKKNGAIKIKQVEVQVRELALSPEDLMAIRPRHGGGIGMCNTISTPSNIKTQRFTTQTYTTASLGNVTVCAKDEQSARDALLQRMTKTIAVAAYGARVGR